MKRLIELDHGRPGLPKQFRSGLSVPPGWLGRIVCGGLVAAVVSTVAQVVLWLLFTDAFPRILYRDARLAAAIVLGPEALTSSEGFDLRIMAVASVVHLALSLVYAAIFCSLTDDLPAFAGVIAGGVLGAILYPINMYGFTTVFPWFSAARDPITLAAHVVFGMACVAGCRWAGSLGRRGRGP